MKKTLALLLTLFVVLTVSTVTVFAAETDVAKIGETGYATIEAAFAAANDGETITLLADAAPVLTSQRAITKASVIDLNGNTLTLTEDDLYFGTIAFKNGNIVVDPSVKPSTAVFWMFANQTLTFDGVKLTATGVTGTYLIGLDGNNSDLNLLNGSEIIIDNTTALDLDVICVNASTGNDIVIEDSKVSVNNLDGRVFFRGNYTVSGASDIDLSGITKAGFRIEAGQTLTIEDTATVDITGEPRDGGIHLVASTSKYTKAETATVNATVEKPAPAGNNFNGYTRGDAIWGEVWGNATESFVIKVLDANDNVMGTTSLNNIGGILNGNVNVTWSIKLDAASNTDEYWTMEWTTAPSLDNMPAKVELWVDGVKVSGGNVVLNGPDNIHEIYAATTDADGKILSYEKSFEDAITAGDNVAILRAGTYKVPSGKNITVTGAVDGVVFDNIGAHNMGSASVTFNNVTFNYAANSTYKGLQHSGNLVYNNCIFNGQVFLYGLSETFNTCTFNNIGDNYNVWTYGAKEVVFNGCTFNSDGKSVLVYNESATHFIDLTVVDSDFNASAPVDGKAAIEIDTSLTAGASISVDAATTATGFGTGNKSGNSLWNNKKGNDTEANNDVTVAVAGETVLKPVVLSLSGTGTAEDPFLINNLEELIWFRDHVDSCEQDGSSQYAGKYIKLTADIDLEGINWEPIGSATADHGSFYGCFDGDGHTIYNLYVEKEGKGLGFFAKTSGGGDGPRAQVKNLNFHNVTVKSTDNSSYVGGVIGNSGGNTYIENVHLTGTINISGYGYVGGIVGHGYPDIRNCSVDGGDASKSIIACGYWAVGGIVGYSGNEEGPETIGCSVKNITIKTAIYGAGSILGVGHKGDITDITAENVVVTAPGTPDANGLLVGCNYKEITGNSWTKNVTLIVDGIIVDNPQDMIAKVNEVSYITLQAALAAATDGDTVILLNNISDSVDYNVNKTLTLDLNGYEIESDADVVLTASAGELTIVDNSADKTGAIVSDGKTAIHSSAYVAIKSGKFDGAITTANGQIDDSQVCITGGTFTQNPDADLVEHSYTVLTNEDGTYTVVDVEYSLTIINAGANASGAGIYIYGDVVTVYAGEMNGYFFGEWVSEDVDVTGFTSDTVTFVMPDHDVTLTVYWSTHGPANPSTPVVLPGTLNFETNGGTPIDSISRVAGTKVDLSQFVTVREGYTFTGWYSDAALTKPVTAITVRSTKTVYAGWIQNAVTPDIPVVVMPFTDVAADAYYYNAVLWAVNTGITTGMTDTMFGPDLVCTRAQVVTFLWRAAGCPVATNNDMPFADVSRDMYYYDAVLWAVEMGITNGISDTEFAPDAECSRAQIVTFLWRALGAPDAAADAGFVDVDADAYYATAVEWAVDNGITNGMGDNTFGADADCTRGQTVTFLFRFFCK